MWKEGLAATSIVILCEQDHAAGVLRTYGERTLAKLGYRQLGLRQKHMSDRAETRCGPMIRLQCAPPTFMHIHFRPATDSPNPFPISHAASSYYSTNSMQGYDTSVATRAAGLVRDAGEDVWYATRVQNRHTVYTIERIKRVVDAWFARARPRPDGTAPRTCTRSKGL